MRTKNSKKETLSYRYAKGLRMTDKQIRNPEDFTSRVCVAYDKNHEAKPYTYVLIGNHDHSNEHDIRRIYAKTTGINYLDARIILYETYVKRIAAVKEAKKEARKAARRAKGKANC
jgi:phosphotransacetylase